MEADYKDLNVKHFKLTSGDEILGLVAAVDNKKGVMHLEYPVLIDMVGNNYMMLDYMPTSANNLVVFNLGQVIAQSDVHDTVKLEYVNYCLSPEADSREDNHSEDPLEALLESYDSKNTYH